MSDLKGKLLAKRAGVETEKYEIPGVGEITLRGLTRAEMLAAEKRAAGDLAAQERYILSWAIVDPKLTVDDIRTWQDNSQPMEINGVASAINRLSGIGKDAQKSGVPDVRG